jgi:hypothetical protein
MLGPSVGSVGDALDNALAETTVGSFKNELIRRQGPPGVTSTRSRSSPLSGWCGSTPNDPTSTSTTAPPKAAERLHYDHRRTKQWRGDSNSSVSGLTGMSQRTYWWSFLKNFPKLLLVEGAAGTIDRWARGNASALNYRGSPREWRLPPSLFRRSAEP